MQVSQIIIGKQKFDTLYVTSVFGLWLTKLSVQLRILRISMLQ